MQNYLFNFVRQGNFRMIYTFFILKKKKKKNKLLLTIKL